MKKAVCIVSTMYYEYLLKSFFEKLNILLENVLHVSKSDTSTSNIFIVEVSVIFFFII